MPEEIASSDEVDMGLRGRQRPVLLRRQGREAMARLRGDHDARSAVRNDVAEFFEHTSLDFSPLPGKQGIDQTSRFKARLRSLQKKLDGVSLLTVTYAQPPHMEVIARYDADNADAAAWVKQAEAVSGELWQKMAERRKGAAR